MGRSYMNNKQKKCYHKGMIYEKKYKTSLLSSRIQTPLGDMIAIANQDGLYLLDFTDRKHLDHNIQSILKTNGIIQQGNNPILDLITEELKAYFAGNLKNFTTPIHFLGSEFQRNAWNFLTMVSYGMTRSYLQQAIGLGNEKACRAVAHANSKNILAIIVPCHRIIASNGKLCGYAGGVERKKWLICHEEQNQISRAD